MSDKPVLTYDIVLPADPIPVVVPPYALEAAAIFDETRAYRFSLMRRREEGTGDCLFIMLNPSTADETVLDPTVTRCRNYAWAWGYHRLLVANIFALRSTDPEALYTHPRPQHGHNMQVLRAMARNADLIVCAWGTHGAHMGMGEAVKAVLERDDGCILHHLGLNKDGSPKHPLYLKADLTPIRWT